MANQAIQTESKMKGLLTSSADPIKAEQILEGKVIEISKKNIFIDFGPLGTGIILGKEIKENPSLVKELKIGQMVNCFVLEPENNKGYIEVSLREANKELSWEKLEELKNSGQTITARVLQANRGGLLMDVMGQGGFLPVSQLSFEHYPRVDGGSKDKILQELNKFVGQELKVKILDLDTREDKIILSEKALNKEEIKEIMDHFKVNDIFEGTVTAITDFGAFVKLIDADRPKISIPEGLIHISELDWQLVKNPRDIVKVNEKVKVKIIGFHQGRISLSLKALKEKPQTQSKSTNTSV
ncbi:S1 RNA-binding domain-containing protein [Patescibacteria group bacterium]|nr:S1 RNA-binding domain-containing protein [Patescibacteria group bacterium]